MPTNPFSLITKKKLLQLLWPITLFLLVQITSNVRQKHVVLSYVPCQTLEQINHNLHNYILMTSYANHQYARRSAMYLEYINLIEGSVTLDNYP